MGAGAVAGGAIGGAIAGYAKELYGWARAKYLGLVYFSFDDTTLAILMDRQLQLLTALQHRTHASQVALTRGSRGYGENAWSELTTVVTKIRAHPEWCGIGGEPDLNIGRDEAIRCIRDLYATESSKME